MDFYLEEQNAINRLVEEYKKFKSIIIALDFDDTIYDFWGKGRKYDCVINLVRRCVDNLGCKVVIYTCNKDHALILDYCKKIDLKIEGINKQLIPIFEGSGKLYYNVLVDDRAGLRSAYNELFHMYLTIMEESVAE